MERQCCDRCGPAVVAYVSVPVGQSWLFYCGSCAARFWPRLIEVAGGVRNIIDERHLIH